MKLALVRSLKTTMALGPKLRALCLHRRLNLPKSISSVAVTLELALIRNLSTEPLPLTFRSLKLAHSSKSTLRVAATVVLAPVRRLKMTRPMEPKRRAARLDQLLR